LGFVIAAVEDEEADVEQSTHSSDGATPCMAQQKFFAVPAGPGAGPHVAVTLTGGEGCEVLKANG
jgi:hypothetical protein